MYPNHTRHNKELTAFVRHDLHIFFFLNFFNITLVNWSQKKIFLLIRNYGYQISTIFIGSPETNY